MSDCPLPPSPQIVHISAPSTPDTILADGQDFTTIVNPFTGTSGPARKGTIAATINNIALLNKLLETSNTADINLTVDTIKPLITSLKNTGIFDLFTPLEWLSTPNQLGRVLVAVLFLQENPSVLTRELKSKLADIRVHTISQHLKNEIDKLL